MKPHRSSPNKEPHRQDQSKTKRELIQELVILRKKIAGLDGLDLNCKQKGGEAPQPVEGPDRNPPASDTIRVSGISVAWNTDQGTCTFEDLPVAMMWVNTTLAGLMSGVQAMVGTERFFLALQSEGRKSVEEDWQIISRFSNFDEGFKAIANIAAVAGWGHWELISLNSDRGECCFRVTDNWEGRYQKSLGVSWGSGMLAGKLAGYCSKLFGTNCWADQTKFIAKGDPYDEFAVKISPRLIENEIERLLASDEATRADMAVALRKLETEITERKQAEEALRESEARFRDLAELLPEIVFEIDQQAHLTFANQNAFANFGYTREDFVGGLNVLDMVVPDDRGRVLENIQRISNNGDTGANEYLMRRKDGSVFPGLVYSTAIIREGTFVGLRGFIVDITERKRAEEEKRKLEEQLQRAEKMESLGTLAGGVAHDLNNVLGIIVGFSELLLFDVEASSPLRPGLVNILNGSQKAAAIVQDLLTLARRGVSGRQVLNLNKIVVEVRNSPEFMNLSSYHPLVRIKTDLEPDLLNISGSAVHLGKALFNLVSNASEAMPKGGTLTINTSNQYLDKPIQGYDEIREGDYVVLSVSDTGEGIKAADLKHIFEPFYTKKVMGRSGTGLGLAVVWGSVKDHQGYINVQSEEGKGSTFTLYFPVTREELTPEEIRVSISEYQGKGETILIVDDVKGQRDLAEEMLKKLNYQVSSVSSGEEAVAYMREHAVDLLVLDMIMDTGLDGLDTYRRILEIHPRQKAIIVSGFSESARMQAARDLGAGAYVKKPYVIEKLGRAVRKELDQVS